MQEMGVLKIAEFVDILGCGKTTSDAITKQTPQLDSAHQLGPETTSVEFLIVVGVCRKLEFKNIENWRRFGLQKNNQRCYRQTDISIGFSASNRSRNNLGRDSIPIMLSVKAPHPRATISPSVTDMKSTHEGQFMPL